MFRYLLAASVRWGGAAVLPTTNTTWVNAVVNGGHGSHIYGYPSYSETGQILDSVLEWDSRFASRVTVGLSYQCRSLDAYWLSGWGFEEGHGTAAKEYQRSLAARFAARIYDEESEILTRCLHEVNTTDLRRLVDLGRNHRALAQRADGNDDDSAAEGPAGIGRMMVTSLHHAREPTSLTTVLYAHLWLAGNFARWAVPPTEGKSLPRAAALAAALLVEREWLWLPFVNPDSYIAIEKGADHMMRKNRRPTCEVIPIVDQEEAGAALADAGPPRAPDHGGFDILGFLRRRWWLTRDGEGMTVRESRFSREYEGVLTAADGVDLNRNYDSHFVRSHKPCDLEEYEGAGPFSEPETRAVRRMAAIFAPQTALNFHSFGDVWTHPYNCCPGRKFNQRDSEIFEELRQVLNVSEFGAAPDLPALGYAATGEADDYLLDEFGIISMSPEVGPEDGGFYPPASKIEQINRENLPRILQVFSKAGSELSVDLGNDSMTFVNSGLIGTRQGYVVLAPTASLPDSVASAERSALGDHVDVFMKRQAAHSVPLGDSDLPHDGTLESCPHDQSPCNLSMMASGSVRIFRLPQSIPSRANVTVKLSGLNPAQLRGLVVCFLPDLVITQPAAFRWATSCGIIDPTANQRTPLVLSNVNVFNLLADTLQKTASAISM